MTFTQHNVFRLVAYHLTQKGPAFGEASSEVSFDRDSGRYRASSGDKSAEGTLDLPEDLHNGMTGMLLRNLPTGGRASGYLMAFTPKPQLVRSDMGPEGEDRFSVGDATFTAVRHLVKLDIPGLKGAIANLIGKNPPDIRYWVSSGVGAGLPEVRGRDVPQGARLDDRAGPAALVEQALKRSNTYRAPQRRTIGTPAASVLLTRQRSATSRRRWRCSSVRSPSSVSSTSILPY